MGRDDLDGVDGFAAVLLWQAFERNGNERILETLLAYNVADVLSLEALAEYALARLSGNGTPQTPVVKSWLNPHAAHKSVLQRVLGHSL